MRKLLFLAAVLSFVHSQLVGGYQQAPLSECKKAHHKVIYYSSCAYCKMLSCKRQIVAGTNYKMKMDKYGQGYCTMVVYKDLSGTYSLTQNDC